MLIGVPGLLNESRYNSSSTETGVQVTVTVHGPTPSEGGTCYHRREITRPPPLLCPQGSENLLTYPSASHSRTRGAPQWES
ncbi:hypothetical protein AVEN_251613-1 [Araneus ventricosus]|uniref:Uncharacterized protein n=1 Tax=Araneus ventricosus TaxID=182803 RepID=A0A4Y2EXE7_ARAVE|nr:hypothetical protein AVEN_251613-1 [Araneus ventricosus]